MKAKKGWKDRVSGEGKEGGRKTEARGRRKEGKMCGRQPREVSEREIAGWGNTQVTLFIISNK
jgi:hypothetical protein